MRRKLEESLLRKPSPGHKASRSENGRRDMSGSSRGPVIPPWSNDERRLWREYYRAALTGIVAAHVHTPNPELVAKLAAKIADVAVEAEIEHWGNR
jgi:hypothetical protein